MFNPDPELSTSPVLVEDMRPYLKALLYGPWGCGKTTLAATAQSHPDMRDVLFLNFEGGLLSVAGVPGIKTIKIINVDHLEQVFWKLVNKDSEFVSIKTLVIDSGTELQTKNLEFTAKKEFDKELAHKKKKRESPDEIFQKDYGLDTNRLKRVFRMFRDSPFHIIVTALSKKIFAPRPKNEPEADPELIEVCPAFTTKLGNSVAGYMDHVWYMFQKGEEETRYLLTSQKGVYLAKTRGPRFYNKMGQIVENPNLSVLFDMLLQSENLKLPK